MGMAASQARLLALTARQHDVELKAQNIMAQKLGLATQKDELYQEYCAALDATKIKVAYLDSIGNKNYVDANYSTLCSFDQARQNDYALRDNKTGNIIVSEEIKKVYDNFSSDKYSFAFAMLGLGTEFGWEFSSYQEGGKEIGIGTANDDYSDEYAEWGIPVQEGDCDSDKEGKYNAYMTEVEADVFNEKKDEDGVLVQKFQEILDAEGDANKRVALSDFRKYLYQKYSREIFDKQNINKQVIKGSDDDLIYPDKTWDDFKAEFEYYTNLWEVINEAGGCQAIDPLHEKGEDGNTWFQNMVEAGLVTIMVYDATGHEKKWSDTSVSTSTGNNHLEKMQDDIDLKKAEAEYEHELGIINKKDTKFDTELSKLETERSAIKTEIDAIKQVRDDNIDKTFKIFS